VQLLKEKHGTTANLPCGRDAPPCARHLALPGEGWAPPEPDLLGLLRMGEAAPSVADPTGRLGDGAEDACTGGHSGSCTSRRWFWRVNVKSWFSHGHGSATPGWAGSGRGSGV